MAGYLPDYFGPSSYPPTMSEYSHSTTAGLPSPASVFGSPDPVHQHHHQQDSKPGLQLHFPESAAAGSSATNSPWSSMHAGTGGGGHDSGYLGGGGGTGLTEQESAYLSSLSNCSGIVGGGGQGLNSSCSRAGGGGAGENGSMLQLPSTPDKPLLSAGGGGGVADGSLDSGRATSPGSALSSDQEAGGGGGEAPPGGGGGMVTSTPRLKDGEITNDSIPRLSDLRVEKDVEWDADSDEKPPHSYIALISMAIFDSAEQKLLLCDIYEYIMNKFKYYRIHEKEKAWRNSIRHNLSLNECFIKDGRSDNGKGNFWAIHPACRDDFRKGDYRRRHARRRAKRQQAGLLGPGGMPGPGGYGDYYAGHASAHSYVSAMHYAAAAQAAHARYNPYSPTRAIYDYLSPAAGSARAPAGPPPNVTCTQLGGSTSNYTSLLMESSSSTAYGHHQYSGYVPRAPSPPTPPSGAGRVPSLDYYAAYGPAAYGVTSDINGGAGGGGKSSGSASLSDIFPPASHSSSQNYITPPLLSSSQSRDVNQNLLLGGSGAVGASSSAGSVYSPPAGAPGAASSLDGNSRSPSVAAAAAAWPSCRQTGSAASSPATAAAERTTFSTERSATSFGALMQATERATLTTERFGGFGGGGGGSSLSSASQAAVAADRGMYSASERLGPITPTPPATAGAGYSGYQTSSRSSAFQAYSSLYPGSAWPMRTRDYL